MIILDTNVVSAVMAEGAEAVAEWLGQVDGDTLYITAITRAEIRFGIARLPDGARRARLASQAEAFLRGAEHLTLAFESRAADRYGEMVAERRSAGRPLPVLAAQIAAIAWVHGAVVATRNTKDFADCGVELVNPFDA